MGRHQDIVAEAFDGTTTRDFAGQRLRKNGPRGGLLKIGREVNLKMQLLGSDAGFSWNYLVFP